MIPDFGAMFWRTVTKAVRNLESLKAGEAFVNLSADPRYEHRWWGRAIFRVDDVDAHYRAVQAQGLILEAPQDAPWGERFFHLTDPDGHELSFAELLPVRA